MSGVLQSKYYLYIFMHSEYFNTSLNFIPYRSNHFIHLTKCITFQIFFQICNFVKEILSEFNVGSGLTICCRGTAKYVNALWADPLIQAQPISSLTLALLVHLTNGAGIHTPVLLLVSVLHVQDTESSRVLPM